MARKVLAIKVFPGQPIPAGYTAGTKLRSGAVIYKKEVDEAVERQEIDELSAMFGSMGLRAPEVVVVAPNVGMNALISQLGDIKIGGKRKSRKQRKSIKRRKTRGTRRH